MVERRRLENRSREEGLGRARDETVGVAETSGFMLRAKRPPVKRLYFREGDQPESDLRPANLRI